MAAERRFLVINPFGIGDVLFSTALLRCLKDAFPGSKLFYLCNRKTASILRSHPLVDGIVVYERDDFLAAQRQSLWQWLKMFRGFIAGIRALRCDTAIDLSLNTQYSFFAWLAGIRSRAGLDYKRRCRFLTARIPIAGYHDKHVAEYYLDVLSLLGVAPQARPLEIAVDRLEASRADDFFKGKQIPPQATVIGIAPCGGDAFGKDAFIKRWPAQQYRMLIERLLLDPGVYLFLFAGPKEKADLDMILAGLDGRGRVFEFTDASLELTVALIDRCALFISNDTGPLRFADGLNKKIVAIFGPVDEKVYGPYPMREGRTIVLSKPLDCRPCYQRFRLAACSRDRECLRSITVDEVLGAVNTLLLK